MQARIGALLSGCKGPDVFSALHHKAHALLYQLADGSDLLVVLVQSFCNRHTHTLPCPKPRPSAASPLAQLVQVPLGVTVAAAAHAVNESPQARIGALLCCRRG